MNLQIHILCNCYGILNVGNQMTFFENALWTKEPVPLGLIQPLGHRWVIILSQSLL